MSRNPLISLLKSFKRKEMTRFVQFVDSPYFNKHKEVRQLVNLLNSSYPEFAEQDCNSNLLWNGIGQKKPLDKKKLSMLFTYTQRLALQFLSSEELNSDSLSQVEYQLQALRDRKQYKLYQKLKRSHVSTLEESKEMDAKYFLHKSRFFHEENAILNQRGIYDKGELVDKKLGMLDRFYLTEKLKDACELFQRAKGKKQQFISPLTDFALQEIKTNISNYSDAPSLVAYFHIYQMLIENTNEYFFIAKKSINQYKTQLSFDDKNNTYNSLLNFCILRINKGEQQFRREAFELFKILLEEKLLIVADVLPEWHYKNIATIGLLVNEVNWTQKFVEEYKSFLSEEHRENAYNYNLASVYYQTKNYKEMFPLLLRVEYTDWRYAVAAKVLLLKTYYDIEEGEALSSLYDSFRQYIKRNKNISELQSRRYNNLIKFTHRIFNLKVQKGYFSKEKFTREFEKLHTQIKETAQCFNRNWILEKMKELS